MIWCLNMSGDSRQSLHFVTFFTEFSQIYQRLAARQTDGLAEAPSSS
jgi:hypothetical protein